MPTGSAALKPTELFNALMSSHSLVSAWDSDLLVGLGNAISDGLLVVYYWQLTFHLRRLNMLTFLRMLA
jgi:hypothetical protein